MKVLPHVSLKYHLTKNDILAQFDNIVFLKKIENIYIFFLEMYYFSKTYI